MDNLEDFHADGPAEFFTRQRAIGLIKSMLKHCRQDPSPALIEIATGANGHPLALSLFALDKAIEDMEKLEKIENILD